MTRTSGHLLTLGAGLLVGFVASRLLPIGIAAASGAIRAASGKDPFDILIRQHKELLSLLDRMEALTTHQIARRNALAYWFKRQISKHAMAEEDVVYPMLHDDAQRAEQADKLYAEHAQMKILLFELQRAVHSDEAWQSAVRGLRAEIEPHARQEEQEEFPRLRELLDQREKIKLGRQIHQFEAVIV